MKESYLCDLCQIP